MNYIKDKVIIIDKEEMHVFKKEFEKNHQCYLDDYAKDNNYEYPTIEYLSKCGNCVFEIIGPIQDENYIIGFLPEKLTDMQLYNLELLRETISNANLIEIKKWKNDREFDYYSMGDNSKSCEEYFYNVILQSYFEKEDENPMIM